MAEINVFQLLAQVPIIGIFGWLVFHTQRAWHRATAEMGTQHQATYDALRADIQASTRQTYALTRVLLHHDMTVRGTNPETVSDTREVVDQLLRELAPHSTHFPRGADGAGDARPPPAL